MCIDLWITAESALGLKGDNRGEDLISTPAESRSQIVINYETRTAYFTVSKSCLANTQFCRPPSPDNHVRVAFRADGSIRVEYDLTNSITGSIGPAINGQITLVPDDAGSYLSAGDRDNFPSIVIARWDGQTHRRVWGASSVDPLNLLSTRPNQKWCQLP